MMTSNRRSSVATLVASLMLGATLGIGTSVQAIAEPETPMCLADGYTSDQLFSTDNPDCLPGSVINEDEQGWSCVDDGNRICGPDNTEGKPAGCYDDGGVLVVVWPCSVVVNVSEDGSSSDIYQTELA